MDEWKTGFEAGSAVVFSPAFQNVRDGQDLGGTAIEEEFIIRGFCAGEDSEDRLRRQKEEEEKQEQEQGQGQKKGALNRSRKSGKKKKKEKEEGRKSFAGVFSKLFGRSSTHEEKETINGPQSNAADAGKHRQPSEANDDDDDDDYDDDDNNEEEAMWSDDEFDEEYDDDEVYSNVNELRVDLVAKIENGETTTTKSTSASTKATPTTTNDLITFESEDAEDVERKVEKEKDEETFADTEIDRSSDAKSSGNVLTNVPFSRRCDEIDCDLSKNIDHDQSRRVDNVRQDQETDQMASIQSTRRFFEVGSNIKKSALSKFSKAKNEIQNFGSKNEAKLEPKRAKHVIGKPDQLDFAKNKTVSSNDKAGIRRSDETKKQQQVQRDLKTTNKSTLPTGQTYVWSRTESPSDRFTNKQCTAATAAAAAASGPQRSTAKGRSATGSEASLSGEGTSDANRSKIAAVHSLVKLFDNGARSRSPDLSRTPRRPAANDVVRPIQQPLVTGDSKRELGIREKPALKKKPVVETPKHPNSSRLPTATPVNCSAPLVLSKRVVNPGKRSPPPAGSCLSDCRHPTGSRTSPSSAPTDNAATVIRVHHEAADPSAGDDSSRWKRPPVKASGQVLPPVPSASPKEPSKIGAKGTCTVSDIPNSGTMKPPHNNRVNQVGELRINLRKAPSERYSEEEPLVEIRSASRQPPSVPYRPLKFPANDVTDGNVFRTDRLNEKQTAEKQLEQQAWYFGDSSREECEARLKSVGQTGTFVVRRSKFGGEKCPYTLSVYLDQATVSLSIRRRTDNTYALGTEKTDEKAYSDVVEIVDFHRINPVRLHTGKTVTLKTSPPK